MSTTPTAIPTEAAPSATALQPASTGRRVVAWLIDIVIVAALVGIVYLVGLVKINGCDTWDPATQQFGGSCPFESTREVTRSDGSVDLVYVLDSGRELPADHPTVKTVLLGTRIVDPPSAGTYLVGLGYVLVVFVVVQGLLGWTPGKLLAGIRLAREDGRSAGIPGAFVRWLVIDGVIGLFGVVMGLVGAWWPLRLFAADAALLLVGGVVALVAGGRQPGDRVAGTLVVDEAALALRKASMSGPVAAQEPTGAPAGPPVAFPDATGPDATGPDTVPTGPTPTPWAAAGTEHGATAGAAAGAAATFAAGRSGPAEPLDQPPVADPSGPTTTPTPLPQWPTTQPTEEPTTEAPAAGPPAGATAPPPSSATPLGASVGAAPSALRRAPSADGPTDAPAATTTDAPVETTTEAPVETTTEAPIEAPAEAPVETSAMIAAAGDPAVDEPAPVTEEPPAGAEPPATEPAAEQTPTGRGAEPEPEPDALVPTSATPSGTSEAASPAEATGSGGEAAIERPVRQPEWDEARRAYIFWDDGRQEWLQYFDDTQAWGPITRA